MKILIIGGGPAGLALSMLLAESDPSHQIALLERNQPNEDPGWGKTRSTFILECSESGCQASGILRLPPEEMRQRLQASFDAELGGHPIIFSKRIGWRQFATVTCRRWSHGNVVLIGDAAHTAHFSQGFGTMLAFDDALALHGALARSKDVPSALESYEKTQKAKVDSLQITASISMQWSESILGAVQCQEETRVSELIAARWPNNLVTAGPLSS